MAAQSFTQLKTRFNTWLRDAANNTWTDAEKIEHLTSAMNDPYVFIIDVDKTITTTTTTLSNGSVINTPSYTAPSTIMVPTDLWIDQEDTGYPYKIDRQAWEFINGTINFRRDYQAISPNHALWVYGKRKLGTFDLIPDQYQEYILHLACVEAFEMLKTQYTESFLKNDRTMAEIIASINTHRSRAAELRSRLTYQYSVTL